MLTHRDVSFSIRSELYDASSVATVFRVELCVSFNDCYDTTFFTLKRWRQSLDHPTPRPLVVVYSIYFADSCASQCLTG